MDYPALMDPRTMGILSAAFAGLGASGPSRMPVSLGQVIGQAGQAGLGTFQHTMMQNQQMQQQKVLQDLHQAQIGQMQQNAAAAQQQQDNLAKFAATLPSNEQAMFMASPGEYLKAKFKNQMENPFSKIDPKDYTPESVRAFIETKNPSALVAVRKSELSPAGVAYNPYELKPGTVMADPNKPFSVGNDGKPVANTPYQQYELNKANAGATRVQTQVNSFTPASEEAQKDFIRSTRTNYDALRGAPVAIQSIEEAKKLIPGAKGFMGPGGESLLEAAKFLNNRLGTNIDTAGVKDAEELRTRIFMNIMDNLKKMDASPSQMQQQIMMDSLGKLGTDPGALPRVLDAFSDVIKGKVALHNKEVKDAEGKGVKFPYNPIIDLPGQGGAPAPAAAKQPPQAAINRLKMNPREAAQFDAIFGEGAAAKVLGK